MVTRKVRFAVFLRDKFTCQYCGRQAPEVVIEIDHVLPCSKGGTNDLNNLVTACRDCNRGKSERKITPNIENYEATLAKYDLKLKQKYLKDIFLIKHSNDFDEIISI